MMDADEHDRLLAYLSHLPQLTVSALMHVVGEHAGAEGCPRRPRAARHDAARVEPGRRRGATSSRPTRDNIGTAHRRSDCRAAELKRRRRRIAAAPRADVHVGGPLEGRARALMIRSGLAVARISRCGIARAAARRPADPSRSRREVHGCPASFWRYLYTEVGRAYHWIDRLPWTDDEIRAYLRTRRCRSG